MAGIAVTAGAAEMVLLASLFLLLPAVAWIIEPGMEQTKGLLTWMPDVITDLPRQTAITLLMVTAVAFIAIGQVGSFASKAWTEVFCARLFARMCRKRMSELMEAPYPWFLQRNASVLVHSITRETQMWSYYQIGALMRMFAPLLAFTLAGAIVFILMPLWGLAMAVLLGALAPLTVQGTKTRIMRPAQEEVMWAQRSEAAAGHMLHGVKDVLASCRSSHFLDLFHDAISRRTTAQATAATYAHAPMEATFLAVQAGLPLLLLAIWTSGVAGGELVAQFAVLVLATIRAAPAAIRFQRELSLLIRHLPWGASMLELDESARLAGDAAPRRAGGLPPETWREILFNQVSFSYPNSSKPALHATTFRIPRGGAVGLSGPSGAGKSTCADLLIGLLQPTGGAIAIGGQELAALDLDLWRRRIGYIPQEPYLLDNTVAENIAFGLDIDRTSVAQAVENAGLSGLISELPDGIDTQLGDQGRSISGGQRQRIAIARALYRQPDLLVLDEATSALDAETEADILKTLNGLKGQLTILIVSHRPAPLGICDSIIELDAGVVVSERGDMQAIGGL